MSSRQNSSQTKNVLRVVYVPRNMMKPASEWLRSIGAKAVSRRTDLDDVSADKYAISYTSREDSKGKFIGVTSSTETITNEEVPVKEKKEKAPKEERKHSSAKEDRSEKKSHRSESSRSETRHRDSDGKKEKREGKH